MKNAKKGSISKRLGIPTAAKLTASVIKEKIRILKKGLADDRYKGELRDYAVYYKNWYAYRLKQRKPAGTKARAVSRKKATPVAGRKKAARKAS